jgi:hypothetical protein
MYIRKNGLVKTAEKFSDSIYNNFIEIINHYTSIASLDCIERSNPNVVGIASLFPPPAQTLAITIED